MKIRHSTSLVQLNPVLPSTLRIAVRKISDHEKGQLSEERTKEALVTMIELHEKGIKIRELKTPPVIGFIHAREEHELNLERKGVDFIAFLEGGISIPLQTKSSVRSARKFMRKHKLRSSKGWFTIVSEALVIDPYENVNSVIKKIAAHLNKVYLKFKQRYDRMVSIARQKLAQQDSRERLLKSLRFIGIDVVDPRRVSKPEHCRFHTPVMCH